MSVQFDESFFRDQFDRLRDDSKSAIEEVKSEYQDLDEIHENATYWMIAILSRFVTQLQQSQTLADWLYNHKFWPKSGHRPKRNSLYLVTARFLLGAQITGTRTYERARNYAKVAERLAASGVKPEEVVEELKEKKIKTILDFPSCDTENIPDEGNSKSQRRIEKDTSGRTKQRGGPTSQPAQSAGVSSSRRQTDKSSGDGRGRQSAENDDIVPRRREVFDAADDVNDKGEDGNLRDFSEPEMVPILPGEFARDFDEVSEGEQIVVNLRCEATVGHRPVFRVLDLKFSDEEDAVELDWTKPAPELRPGERRGARIGSGREINDGRGPSAARADVRRARGRYGR